LTNRENYNLDDELKHREMKGPTQGHLRMSHRPSRSYISSLLLQLMSRVRTVDISQRKLWLLLATSGAKSLFMSLPFFLRYPVPAGINLGHGTAGH